MNNASKLTKFILAIDHTADYKSGFTYYALKSTDKDTALVEAALKSTKAKSVYCWLLLTRNGNGETTKDFTEYSKVARVCPDRVAKKPTDDFGDVDYDFSTDIGGKVWGYIHAHDIA